MDGNLVLEGINVIKPKNSSNLSEGDLVPAALKCPVHSGVSLTLLIKLKPQGGIELSHQLCVSPMCELQDLHKVPGLTLYLDLSEYKVILPLHPCPVNPLHWQYPVL